MNGLSRRGVAQGYARSIRRLMIFYLGALAVLLASVLTSLVLTSVEASRLERDANDINVSGRQRMLSQRIIYLAQESRLNTGAKAIAARQELALAIEEFEKALELFERAHKSLTTQAGLPTDIRTLYFGTGGQASLDARVQDYIANARAVLADRNDTASLQALKTIERAGLLQDLDRVVSTFEAHSVARVQELRKLESISIAVALAIILAEVLFVFAPGHRLLNRAFSEVESQNADLIRARKTLSDQNRSLAEKNRQLDVERGLLRTAWRESEGLRREQAEFTYSVSHDMKSPANTLQLLLNELDASHGDGLDQDARDLLDHARNAVSRMSDLIEDVLEYSWATDRRAKPEIINMQIRLRDTLDSMAPALMAVGANVSLEAECGYFGYDRQIDILVRNLVSNAIKFQEQDIRPEITVTCAPGPGFKSVVLSVQDNGIGIDPKNHDRIFGLFQRLHVRETYSGTGLGLATCQRIAANHSGTIAVTSEPGKGATFTVTLGEPVETPQLDELEQAA